MEEVSTHTSSHTRRSSIEGGYEVERAEDDEEFNTPRDPFDENGSVSVSIHPIYLLAVFCKNLYPRVMPRFHSSSLSLSN